MSHRIDYNLLSEGHLQPLETFLFESKYQGVMLSTEAQGLRKKIIYENGVLDTSSFIVKHSNLPKKLYSKDTIELPVVIFLDLENLSKVLDSLNSPIFTTDTPQCEILEYIENKQLAISDVKYSHQVLAQDGATNNWDQMTSLIIKGLHLPDHMEIIYGSSNREVTDLLFVSINSIHRRNQRKLPKASSLRIERLPFPGNSFYVDLI